MRSKQAYSNSSPQKWEGNNTLRTNVLPNTLALFLDIFRLRVITIGII